MNCGEAEHRIVFSYLGITGISLAMSMNGDALRVHRKGVLNAYSASYAVQFLKGSEAATQFYGRTLVTNFQVVLKLHLPELTVIEGFERLL